MSKPKKQPWELQEEEVKGSELSEIKFKQLVTSDENRIRSEHKTLIKNFYNIKDHPPINKGLSDQIIGKTIANAEELVTALLKLCLQTNELPNALNVSVKTTNELYPLAQTLQHILSDVLDGTQFTKTQEWVAKCIKGFKTPNWSSREDKTKSRVRFSYVDRAKYSEYLIETFMLYQDGERFDVVDQINLELANLVKMQETLERSALDFSILGMVHRLKTRDSRSAKDGGIYYIESSSLARALSRYALYIIPDEKNKPVREMISNV